MAKQQTKMFRVLLISNDVFPVNENVSDLYFFSPKNLVFFQLLPPPQPNCPMKRARWGKWRGQNQNHTSRKRTGCKVDFPLQSYCLSILQPQRIISSLEASAFSWFDGWIAVVCTLHVIRLLWHMLSKLVTCLLLGILVNVSSIYSEYAVPCVGWNSVFTVASTFMKSSPRVMVK